MFKFVLIYIMFTYAKIKNTPEQNAQLYLLQSNLIDIIITGQLQSLNQQLLSKLVEAFNEYISNYHILSRYNITHLMIEYFKVIRMQKITYNNQYIVLYQDHNKIQNIQTNIYSINNYILYKSIHDYTNRKFAYIIYNPSNNIPLIIQYRDIISNDGWRVTKIIFVNPLLWNHEIDVMNSHNIPANFVINL